MIWAHQTLLPVVTNEGDGAFCAAGGGGARLTEKEQSVCLYIIDTAGGGASINMFVLTPVYRAPKLGEGVRCLVSRRLCVIIIFSPDCWLCVEGRANFQSTLFPEPLLQERVLVLNAVFELVPLATNVAHCDSPPF